MQRLLASNTNILTQYCTYTSNTQIILTRISVFSLKNNTPTGSQIAFKLDLHKLSSAYKIQIS